MQFIYEWISGAKGIGIWTDNGSSWCLFWFLQQIVRAMHTARFTPETENKLLSLIDEIHSELLLQRKEDMRKWRPPDSDLSKTDWTK